MCECAEYDDGSMYLCPVDYDIWKRDTKRNAELLGLLREMDQEAGLLVSAVEDSDCAWVHHTEKLGELQARVRQALEEK